MGIKLPCVYILFQEYFHKSSIGDVKWKVACLKAEKETDRFGLVQAEAFAMILLKNNYFAWLWEAKQSLGDRLSTDYDNEKDINTKWSADEAFLKAELNLDDQLLLQDEGQDLTEKSGVFEGLLVYERDPLYQDLQKKNTASKKNKGGSQEK